MSDVVWACDYLNAPENDADLEIDFAGFDATQLRVTIARIHAAKPVEPDAIPSRVIATKPKVRQLKAIANIDFTAYSPDVIEVLLGLDLGNCKFHAPKFFAKDGVTELDLDHKFVEYGNVKTTFVADQSPRCEQVPYHNNPKNIDFRYPPTTVKDGDLALSPECLEGPDIWVEQYLRRMIFVSDRAAQALRDAGLSEPFFLKRCRIVG